MGKARKLSSYRNEHMDSDMTRSSRLWLAAALCLPFSAPGLAATAPSVSAEQDKAQAIARVVEIINRPVTHLARTDEAGLFSPGWFHEGAIKPDFANVDVRATQELPYKDYRWVTSDLNPQEMFIASELEFNAMTKYFYQDRSLPKHRLSQDDMVEINALYRRIASDEHAIAMHRFETAGLVAVLLAVAAALIVAYRRAA